MERDAERWLSGLRQVAGCPYAEGKAGKPSSWFSEREDAERMAKLTGGEVLRWSGRLRRYAKEGE